jgi:hypothetical protein
MHVRPTRRFWNIAARTAHIIAAGGLFGGHACGASRSELTPWLHAVIATGLVLSALEVSPIATWWCEIRGAAVLVKVALLAAIPWFWAERVWILALAMIIASVGAHLPRRWRHFSLWHRRELVSDSKNETRRDASERTR